MKSVMSRDNDSSWSGWPRGCNEAHEVTFLAHYQQMDLVETRYPLIQHELIRSIAPTELTRPFRINAGPVHSYTLLADGSTKYLAELEAGDQVSSASWS